MGVLDSSQEHLQISMAFPFFIEEDLAKSVLLLQVDNYRSYKLLGDLGPHLGLLQRNAKLQIKYRIYKNTPIDEQGRLADKGSLDMSEAVWVDDQNDFYFVLKDNSFSKDHRLFYESLKQMCLHYSDEGLYFEYMDQVRRKCFSGPDGQGDFFPVENLLSCAQGIYGSQVKGKSKDLDEVGVTRK